MAASCPAPPEADPPIKLSLVAGAGHVLLVDTVITVIPDVVATFHTQIFTDSGDFLSTPLSHLGSRAGICQDLFHFLSPVSVS